MSNENGSALVNQVSLPLGLLCNVKGHYEVQLFGAAYCTPLGEDEVSESVPSRIRLSDGVHLNRRRLIIEHHRFYYTKLTVRVT